MIWRLLKPQGAIGLVVSAVLLALLGMQTIRVRRWRAQAERAAVTLKVERAATAETVANVRAAAAAAKANDTANLLRVTAEQTAINQRSSDDFEARINDARARAGRLQQQAAAGAADPGGRGTTPVPGLSPSAEPAANVAREDGFPLADRLTATEQAVQLDALIKWVKAQGAVDPGNAAPPSPGVR